jgi:hypothetical protein
MIKHGFWQQTQQIAIKILIKTGLKLKQCLKTLNLVVLILRKQKLRIIPD